MRELESYQYPCTGIFVSSSQRIFLAGCVVTGFMHNEVTPILGKIIFGLAVIPGFMVIGLVLDSGDDEPP